MPYTTVLASDFLLTVSFLCIRHCCTALVPSEAGMYMCAGMYYLSPEGVRYHSLRIRVRDYQIL